MNEKRREELRKWSAELMGWEDCFICNQPNCQWWVKFIKNDIWPDGVYEHIIPKAEYTPDLETAPASQILGVIEAMEKIGWYFAWDGWEKVASFDDTNTYEPSYAVGKFPEAVLEAASAALKGS